MLYYRFANYANQLLTRSGRVESVVGWLQYKSFKVTDVSNFSCISLPMNSTPKSSFCGNV